MTANLLAFLADILLGVQCLSCSERHRHMLAHRALDHADEPDVWGTA